MHKRTQQPRRGIILLVVLTTLTFFSILLAAYLVFSNQSRESSFAIAARNINRADNNAILDQALMTLIRGTADENSPFYGEDLLSDFYGRRDYLSIIIEAGTTPTINNQFVRITCVRDLLDMDDVDLNTDDVADRYAGRVLTFTQTQQPEWTNLTFRVLRSIGTGTNVDLIFAVPPGLNVAQLMGNDKLRMNGVPRNAAGIGFNGTDIALTATPQLSSGVMPTIPLAFQPNHLNRAIDKKAALGTNLASDFDEGYDAADFNNWFLSYRRSQDGTIIPSFHRPSLMNWLLNEQSSWSAANTDLVIKMARATFRPVPIHSSFAGSTLNENFTGGSSSFALRAPLPLSNNTQLDQLSQALIVGPWDVDNDSNGENDSVWIDLDLPLITSPEGKLLKPLIATMIEDLGGRLNINAHHNVELTPSSTVTTGVAGLASDQALWAGTRVDIGNAVNQRNVFRGLGYGPAEIALPTQALSNMVNSRYLRRPGDTVVPQQPGTDNADVLDTLLTGSRPPIQQTSNGYGYSVDPFGRGGTAIGRSGEIVAAESGRRIRIDDTMTANYNELIDDSVNDPYEFDPSGTSRGDLPLTLDEFEVFLRSNDFDLELLPTRLRNLLATSPGLADAITAISVSDDTSPPFAFTNSESTFESIARALLASGVPAASISDLIAPEIRRGNKLDVNRRIGNGIDDTTPANGVIDEPDEVTTETDAFAVPPFSGQTIPPEYNTSSPAYSFGSAVSGRALLARHLYVLMMAATNGVDFPVSDPSVVNAANYKARRLAQWAVNVVDYRDPDSIMTRFQFDPTPFDAGGWSPTETVWGVESPDLIFSEATAFHDVRVRDTAFDDDDQQEKSAMTTPDPNSDQVRIPQGSVFLELLCPRANVANSAADRASNFGFPQELYDNVTAGPPTLDLTRTAPNGAPVWRIAFSEPHFDVDTMGRYAASGSEASDPEKLRTERVETASFDPIGLDEIDSAGTVPTLAIDRFLFFRSFADIAAVNAMLTANPSIGVNAEQVFFLRNATATLEPGQFTVIAPRLDTRLGSHAPAPGAIADRPSDHRFQVGADGVIHIRQDGMRHTPALGNTNSYTQALPLIAETFPPVSFSLGVFANNRVGLNVSEPLPNSPSYYPEPMFQYLGAAGTFPLNDAYVEITTGGMTAPDTPFDSDPARSLRLPPSTSPTTLGDGNPSSDEPALGTIPRYCSAFLQRLANPLVAFDAATNPYRTVDWISIDLNVFSGDELQSNVVGGGDYTQRTRQRNGFTDQVREPTFVEGNRVNALYSYATDFDESPTASLDAMALDYFSFSGADPIVGAMQSSLNFLNTDEANTNPGFVGFFPSIGSEGAGASGVAANHFTDRNFPRVPYALHPWLNRDFASPLELLMVPACSQSRLFEEFSVSTASPIVSIGPPGGMPTITTLTPHGFQTDDWVRIDGVGGVPAINGDYQIMVTGINTFTIAATVPATPAVIVATAVASKIPDVYYPPVSFADMGRLNSWTAPFRHLLNFFHTPAVASETIALGRFLDLVHTKPPFIGEVDPILPANVTTDIGVLYPTPFNFTFDNRRQGTINTNTISNFEVWRGLMQGHLNDSEFAMAAGAALKNQLSFDSFVLNRRGYLANESLTRVTTAGPFNYLPDHFRSELPTEFAGVFRDGARAGLMPTVRDTAATAFLRRRTNDGGVLRGRATLDNPIPAAGETATASKFAVREIRQSPAAPVWTEFPTVVATDSTLPMDRNRNPWMRYQTAMRMPNLTSDNSQVFVVRMTLGFFEVDSSNTNNLGKEYNESIGEAQRYKALFIVDRSIPVGFIPGQDLNARDTVIFERFFQ